MSDSREKRLARQAMGVSGDVRKMVFEHADTLQAGSHVLEIGVGEGRNLPAFKGMGVHLHGIELDPIGIELCRELLQREGMEADLYVGSFAELPFEDASIDAVYSHAALHNARSLEVARKAVCDVARVLRPGGCYRMFEAVTPKVVELNREKRVGYFTAEEVCEFAQASGLTIIAGTEPRDHRADETRVGGRRLRWEVTFQKSV